MKNLIIVLALMMPLSQIASAGQICDINGCRNASEGEDFWNQWYQDQYGRSYDSGYRRDEDYVVGPGFGGGNYDATTCVAWDKSRQILGKSTSTNKQSAKRRALKSCVNKSARPNTCKVSCD